MLLATALLPTLQVGASPPFPEFVDPNPNPGNFFGSTVVPLSTGNVVITAPNDDAGGTDAGAVYLFNGATGALISTLRGSGANHNIGNGGVIALNNGNYVIISSSWDNGAVTNVGAATWGSGTSGVSGVVSSSNSLVGSKANDQVGYFGVMALSNGNYVVKSFNWDNGAATNAGAVTWGNGTSGVSGVVSSSNSLVGSTTNDLVGYNGIVELSNGNYVVKSSDWDNGGATNAGAVTWGSGSSGVSGVVSSSNSLIGSTADDGYIVTVTVLGNGNYLVRNSYWDNGTVTDAGAVTWGNGTSGVSGVISSSNSLIGSTEFDKVGSSGITTLSNGHYVVSSSNWDKTPDGYNVGAVTWGNGTTGITGTVSSSNSLVGSTENDQVGIGGALALSNGNYVVSSFYWNNGTAMSAGAVTWRNGSTATTSTVSVSNSLVGSTEDDQVGNTVIKLTNGNYVVRSHKWDNGTATDAGAVTWCSSSGVTGVVSSSNSLVGSTTSDQVGFGVAALSNGNYVVISPDWDNGAIVNAGAVTWGNGTTGITGLVNVSNSLVGSTANNQVGSSGVMPLNNGNYVVSSPNWDIGPATNAGAVTWCSGITASAGTVTVGNSLIGSKANDAVGIRLESLTNGNYVVRSYNWDNGALLNAGAVTWGSGTSGVSGVVGSSNSLVGSKANDNVGVFPILELSNGNYVVDSPSWDNGAAQNAGAVTWSTGTSGVTGPVSSSNSLVGLTTSTNMKPTVEDAVNGNYLAAFPTEGSGKVRLGSVADGLVPNVISVSPAVGITNGGDSVTVTGRGFTGATVVTFDGVPATNISVVNYNTLTVTTPAHPFGTVNVAVTTPQGTGIGTGLYTYDGPEISVTGNGLSIADGSGAPLMYTHTDFGIVMEAGGTRVHTFTVQNTGTTPLSLTGTPKVVVGGAHAADFTVTSQPASPLGVGSSTTFQVTFNPGGLGLRSATLNIVNDDSDENPFDFAIQGTGDIYTPQQKFDAAMTAASLSGPDAQPTATPKKDGVANLLKYAFNMDLAAPDRRTLVPGSGTAGLPSITRVGNVLRVEYLRRIGSGLGYTPQKRNDLAAASWAALASLPVVTPVLNEPDWERVVHEEAFNPATTPRLFGRVEVTLP